MAPGPAPDTRGTSFADEPISEAVKAQATLILARQTGPIAKIIVKRAADKARMPGELIELLVESAGEPDRALLRTQLRSLR